MTRSELQGKIAKMEAGLENPNIQGAAREALEQSLDKAKKQLAGMADKEEAKPKPGPAKPKKPSKKKTPAQPASAYSWKKKVPVSELKPIQLTCRHYHLPVTKETRVSLKRTGASSVVVTARPGDHLIFDDQGYLVFVMEGKSFERKCAEEKPATKPKAKASRKPKPKAKPSKKPKARPKAKTEGQKVIARFDQEIETIRKKQNKPAEVDASLRELLLEQKKTSLQKNYQEYVARRIQCLEKDEVRITKAEIIQIGIALRPMVQSLRGSLSDVKAKNAKTLEPTLENLIRWTKNPGGYDLLGVDTDEKRKVTTKAKVQPKEKTGWLEWLFGE